MKDHVSMKERVQKGASFLDEHEPDWAEKINPDNLDMSSTNLCVIGQTFGSWSPALKSLNIDEQEYGFDLMYGDHGEDWKTLDALWLKEVKKRTNRGFFSRLLRRNK